MSDYELDRETKVLFAAYFAEYEELKRHYFGPDDDDDDDDLDVALMFGVWRDLEFAKALYKDDQIAKDCFVMDAIAEKFVMNNIIIDELIIKYRPSMIWDPETPTKETCRILIDKFREYIQEPLASLCIVKNWNDLYIELKPKDGSNHCESSDNLEFRKRQKHFGYYKRISIEPRYYYDYVENKEITGGYLDALRGEEYMNGKFIDNGYIYSMKKLNKDFLEI